MSESRTIAVAVNPGYHSREPENEQERIHWETLDTAWTLLREGAVRVAIQSLRDAAAQQGIAIPSDDELLAELGKDGGPESLRDLAPESVEAAAYLAAAFEELQERSFADMREGLAANLRFQEEVRRLTGEE